MSRYDRDQIFINRKKYLTGKHTRDNKFIEHFATAVLNHPGVLARSSLTVDTHIWKYGDRFYNLANKYYGNPELWWIIAWYNGYPTEAHIRKGDVLDIPINLEQVSTALGL